MAGTQYLKSEPTDRVWLTRDQKIFALSYSEPAEAVLSLDRSSGAWRVARGVTRQFKTNLGHKGYKMLFVSFVFPRHAPRATRHGFICFSL